ncbi:hypothetical protein A2U01_0045501, partial [Trifolium medium]|nr:hypothetical protein [Trifolium medium]
VFIRYPYGKKGWKFLDLETNSEIFVSSDVEFIECVYPFAESNHGITYYVDKSDEVFEEIVEEEMHEQNPHQSHVEMDNTAQMKGKVQQLKNTTLNQ